MSKRRKQKRHKFAEINPIVPAIRHDYLPEPTFERLSSQSLASVLPSADQNPDEILKKKGAKIYDEMEEKDAHLYAVYQTRKSAISLIPWYILPADNSDRSRELADFVFQVIDDIRGPFCEKIKALNDAIGKGFAVLEICWIPITKGKWKGKFGIEDLVFHKQKFWRFKERRYNKGLNQDVILFNPNPSHTMDAVPVPWSQVIHYAFDGQESFYGKAAFKPLFWYYWFKKEGWKSWIIYLNKFGMPTVAGQYPNTATPNEKSALLEVVQSIQEETGIIFPDTMLIKLLEASRAGNASYEALSHACNAEMSKGILGATQTVEEGKRGSYALSRAHSDIRELRVEADAIPSADVIQQQLVKRIIDFNFITEIYPQFVMTFKSGETTLKANASIDQSQDKTGEEKLKKQLVEMDITS